MSKNYFDILGVSPEATQAEIKEAYKRLAVQFHPDRNPAEDAEERFKEIREAYDVLGDFYQRLLYEKELGTIHEEPSSPPAPAQPIIEQEEAEEQVPERTTDGQETPNETQSTTTPFWQKKAFVILSAPIFILCLVGLGKVLFGASDKESDNKQKEFTPPPKELLPNRKDNKEPNPEWTLRKTWSSNPVLAIQIADSLQHIGKNTAETDSIRKLATSRLVAKSSYYFQTSDCQKGRSAYELAIEKQVKITPHQRKELDFYQVRCAREQGDTKQALALLAEMESNYQHTFSILLAKATIFHQDLKSPKKAIPLYEKLRYLYFPQKADAKFVKFWQSEQKEFSHGELLAQYAQACFNTQKIDLGKRVAIESVKADTNQTLAFELIGNQLMKENQEWGACKYWRKAAENGSAAATDSLLKNCK